MLSMSAARRRLLILVAGCALPLFFIFATTSYFYPDLLPPSLHTKPVATQEPLREPISKPKPISEPEEKEPWDFEAATTTTTSHAARPTTSHSSRPSQTSQSHWKFDYQRDERNFGLNEEQCDAAFPGFYHEIERAITYRSEVGQITRDDVDISWRQDEMIRAMIYDRQLYIIETKWAGHGFDVPRGLAILNSIYRSIVSYPGRIPNIEFSFCIGDVANPPDEKHAVWTLTRRNDEEDKWVMPDFGYWSWALDVVGEYTQVRDEIALLEEKTPFKDKKPLAVWRGAIGTNPLRKKLVEVTKDKSWSDVQEIVWLNMTTMAPGNESLSLTMPEHCLYQYVLHTEGHSYSGRGKYLLNCESVSVMHKLDWVEPHTHLFVSDGPKQNAVQVERDFSDLERKIEDLVAHPADAERIAQNSVRTFRERYLTPAAQACYWRRLFWGWHGVQGFEPELWEEVEEIERSPSSAAGDVIDEEELRDDGKDAPKKQGAEKKGGKKIIVRRMRGTPYETFILQGFKPNPP